MKILDFDTEESFHYENGFYLTAGSARMSKLLSHFELYKMITGLPGHVVECGVFKGASFMRWATFRDILESPYSRRIIGFDTFGEFPETAYDDDQTLRRTFIEETSGGKSIPEEQLHEALAHKKISNYELVKGDILETVPAYLQEKPQLKIALLHIDTDIYEPARAVLAHFYPHLVRGGVLVLDDYGTFPGGTKAVDEYFEGKNALIRKFPFSHHIPSYIIKGHDAP